MGNVDLREFASPAQLVPNVATDWLETVSNLRSAREVVCVALSGGRIARNFLATLAERLAGRHEVLKGVHFFWSDERCVPPDDPESNFHLANEALFIPTGIPENQVHRIKGELPPAEACPMAEAELRHQADSSPAHQPVFDLVLLGMGEDGHVASLFPGEPEAVMTSPAVFRSVTAVKPPPLRITLGFAAIAAARQVWVLASGAGKQDALRESLGSQGRTPLARVIRLRSTTGIYTDISL